MPTVDLADLSFEEALEALEQTVRALEEGNQSLDEAIALFERGMNLARLASERLDAAELRLHTIQVSGPGEGEGLATG